VLGTVAYKPVVAADLCLFKVETMAPTTTGTAKNTRKEYPRRESQSAVYSNNDIDKDCNHRNTSSKAQIAAYLLIILAMAGRGD
jgi:hypothetical protein